MTKTKDQILEEMRETMPFHLPERIRPYIKEAMEIYSNQQLHQCNVVGQSEQLVCDNHRPDLEHFMKYSKSICKNCKQKV